MERLKTQVLQHNDPTMKFKFTPPARATMIDWIHSAWGELTQQTIQSGFRGANIQVTDEPELVDNEFIELLQRCNLVGDIVREDKDFDVAVDEDE